MAWSAILVATAMLLACTSEAEPEPTPTATVSSTTDTSAPTPPAQGPVASTYEMPKKMREVREDGLVWERIAFGEAPLARAKRDEVLDLDGGRRLLVAGGRRGAEAGAWVSEDGGESWAVAQGLAGGGTGSADIVHVGRNGTVALAGAEVDDDSIGAAWFSDDGLRFTTAALAENDVAAGYPYGMTETPSGLVMLDNAVRAWQSEQGRSWRPVRGSDGQPLLLASLLLPTGPVLTEDEKLVALAISEEAQLLTSDDSGQTWSSLALADPALQGAYLRRMIQTPEGTLVAVGFVLVEGDEAEEALVVRSDDNGRTWEAAELGGPGGSGPGRQALTSVIVVDGELIAIGAAGGDQQRWPGAWRSVDDGATWRPIHPGEAIAPRGREDLVEGDTFEDVVAVDDALVIVGHRDHGSRRDVTVWRLSTRS